MKAALLRKKEQVSYGYINVSNKNLLVCHPTPKLTSDSVQISMANTRMNGHAIKNSSLG